MALTRAHLAKLGASQSAYLIPETWCRFLCHLTDVSITTDQRAGTDPLARCTQSMIGDRLWSGIDPYRTVASARVIGLKSFVLLRTRERQRPTSALREGAVGEWRQTLGVSKLHGDSELAALWVRRKQPR